MYKAAQNVPMVEAFPGLLIRAAGMSGNPVVSFLIEEGYPVNPEPDKENGSMIMIASSRY